MNSITDPLAIRAMQLRSARSAIKLEAKGMTRRGRSVTAMYREHFGLPRNASRDAVLAEINTRLEDIDLQLLRASKGEPLQ